MPTYQYVCRDCGQDLEAVQSFSDPALTDCPTCSGRLRKKFGAVGVVFKGAGFYRNDSRSGNELSSASAASSDGSGDKASDDKGSNGKGSNDKSSSDKGSSDKPGTATEKKSDSGADKPAAKTGSSSSSSSSGSSSTAA